MITAEITSYWWLLPLLLILACWFFCGRGCCRPRQRGRDETDRHVVQRP